MKTPEGRAAALIKPVKPSALGQVWVEYRLGAVKLQFYTPADAGGFEAAFTAAVAGAIREAVEETLRAGVDDTPPLGHAQPVDTLLRILTDDADGVIDSVSIPLCREVASQFAAHIAHLRARVALLTRDAGYVDGYADGWRDARNRCVEALVRALSTGPAYGIDPREEAIISSVGAVPERP